MPNPEAPAAVVDHVLICTDAGAPEAERLIRFGLLEGPPNTHPGQGTANRRFFFRSTMLELLWVTDAAEARSPATQPTLLWERWSRRRSEASPFGIVLRPPKGAPPRVPFPSWDYRPAYLAGPLAFQIASDTVLAEPMWIYAGFLEEQDRSIAHPSGHADITAVHLTMPPSAEGRVSRTMADAGIAGFTHGDEHLLTLVFDRGLQDKSADFRPHLPLIFVW